MWLLFGINAELTSFLSDDEIYIDCHSKLSNMDIRPHLPSTHGIQALHFSIGLIATQHTVYSLPLYVIISQKIAVPGSTQGS